MRKISGQTTFVLCFAISLAVSICRAADEFKLSPACVDAAGLVFISSDLNVRAIREMLGTSNKVVKELLESPRHKAAYSEVLKMAHWVNTEQGQEILARTAELINEHQIRAAKEATEIMNKLVDQAKAAYESGDPKSVVSLTKKQSEKEAKELDHIFTSVAKLSAEDLSARQLFHRATREVAARHSGKLPEFDPKWSDKLMGSYVMVPDNFLSVNQLPGLVTAMQKDQRLRGEKAMRVAFAYFGGKPQLAEFMKKVQGPLRPVFPRANPKSLFGLTLFEHVRVIVEGLIAAGHFEPSSDFWGRVDGEIDKMLDRGGTLTTGQRKALTDAAKIYANAMLDDLVPAPYPTVTAATLTAHQTEVLAFHSRQLTQNLANEKEKLARADDPKPGASPKKGPTRKDRLDEYQKRRAADLAEAGKMELNPPAKVEPTPEVKRAGDPPVEIAKPILAEAEIEQVVGLHSLTSARAQNILDFYETMQPGEKERLRNILAQLYLADERNFSKLEGADTGKFTDYSIMEFRLGSVRLHFGYASAEEGPVLLSIYRKNPETQIQKRDSDDKAWRKR